MVKAGGDGTPRHYSHFQWLPRCCRLSCCKAELHIFEVVSDQMCNGHLHLKNSKAVHSREWGTDWHSPGIRYADIFLPFFEASFSFGISTPPAFRHVFGMVCFFQTTFTCLHRNWKTSGAFLYSKYGTQFGPGAEAALSFVTVFSTSLHLGRLTSNWCSSWGMGGMSGGITLCSYLWLSVCVAFRFSSSSVFDALSDPHFFYAKKPFPQIWRVLCRKTFLFSPSCVRFWCFLLFAVFPGVPLDILAEGLCQLSLLVRISSTVFSNPFSLWPGTLFLATFWTWKGLLFPSFLSLLLRIFPPCMTSPDHSFTQLLIQSSFRI